MHQVTKVLELQLQHLSNVSNSESFDMSPKVRNNREEELAEVGEMATNQWNLAVKVGVVN